ncbi:hypothetical protein D5086_027647 [Populus alba]|uniref:Uncharacterized protein n=1 Tax=Populus alba TaxID=43335 RepID=A0ACC4AW11_POPAL
MTIDVILLQEHQVGLEQKQNVYVVMGRCRKQWTKGNPTAMELFLSTMASVEKFAADFQVHESSLTPSHIFIC